MEKQLAARKSKEELIGKSKLAKRRKQPRVTMDFDLAAYARVVRVLKYFLCLHV